MQFGSWHVQFANHRLPWTFRHETNQFILWDSWPRRLPPRTARGIKPTGNLQLILLYLPAKFGEDCINRIWVLSGEMTGPGGSFSFLCLQFLHCSFQFQEPPSPVTVFLCPIFFSYRACNPPPHPTPPLTLLGFLVTLHLEIDQSF